MSRSKATWENMEFYLKRRIYISPNGHWLWTKACISTGYGIFEVDNVLMYAHRASYIIFVGPIPKDKPLVLHKRGICHIRKCICPNHLYVGTHQNNVDDMWADGRHVQGKGNLQISDEFIKTIRLRCAMGETQTSVALDLGISNTHVSDIVNFKYRKDVL